jgi:hypothetical protein
LSASSMRFGISPGGSSASVASVPHEAGKFPTNWEFERSAWRRWPPAGIPSPAAYHWPAAATGTACYGPSLLSREKAPSPYAGRARGHGGPAIRTRLIAAGQGLLATSSRTSAWHGSLSSSAQTPSWQGSNVSHGKHLPASWTTLYALILNRFSTGARVRPIPFRKIARDGLPHLVGRDTTIASAGLRQPLALLSWIRCGLLISRGPGRCRRRRQG